MPVRAFAARLDDETQRMIREELQGPGGMDSLAQRMLNDRIVHAADVPGKPRARNVVLMPAAYVERLEQHLRPAGVSSGSCSWSTGRSASRCWLSRAG